MTGPAALPPNRRARRDAGRRPLVHVHIDRLAVQDTALDGRAYAEAVRAALARELDGTRGAQTRGAERSVSLAESTARAIAAAVRGRTHGHE